MAEYIDKVELKERIRYDFDYSLQLCEDITEVIDSLPTIEIVYCKECKHWEQDNREPIIGVCNGGYVPREINMLYTDYCSYGERKE